MNRSLRIFVADGDTTVYLASAARHVGLTLEITTEGEPNCTNDGEYVVTVPGLKLIANTTPDRYDAIIIGNNLGTGLTKARCTPGNMRGRTLIVWNEYSGARPSSYIELGISHFAQRVTDPGAPPQFTTVEQFLITIAEISA